MDQSTKLVKLPPPQRLNAHSWTNEEKAFKRKERVLAEIKHLNIPLKSALLYKLSRSDFGSFLKEFNSTEYQDYVTNDNKLQILNWHLKRYNDHDLNIIQKRNNCLKNYHALLHKAVNDCSVIDISFLRKHVESLSLDCCFIKQVDNGLQQFQQIKVLTLCGNFIKGIAGSLLPRKLVFLELFDNFIDDVSNLVQNAPTSIKHLGLGRNRLTIGSNLHLLAESRNFANLLCIDLSDNDIYDLKLVLEDLKTFDLRSISLEGNPCAVVPEYKNEILKQFPDLKYLDSTEILGKDRNVKLDKKLIRTEPQLVFQCYRILGLPEPPKDKKNMQTIHIEVNFPLLLKNPPEAQKELTESIYQQVSVEELEETDTEDKKSNNGHRSSNNEQHSNNEHHKKDKAKNKKEKEGSVNNTVKEPKKAKKSYYAADSEYDESFEKQNIWFKTARMPWSKIIEFPPIEVCHPENNTTLIRDTFRSIVPVRVVYLKIAPFLATSKKQQPKKKETEKGLKKPAVEHDASTKGSLETVADVEETVLKKITLASFYCELKSLNWSDKALDFFWAEHQIIGKTALRVEGSLKALEYELTANPKKSKPTKKGEEDLENLEHKEYLPNVLTCQVGFGLNRIYLI